MAIGSGILLLVLLFIMMVLFAVSVFIKFRNKRMDDERE